MAVNWTNITNPAQFLATPNTNTGGYFWTTMLFTLVIILTLSFIQFGIEIALLVALFIGILAGIFLFYLGLVSVTWLGMLVGFELFLVIYVIAMNSKNN